MTQNGMEDINYLFSKIKELALKDVEELEILRKGYLTKSGDTVSSVFILREGVILSSIPGTSGNNVNISYMDEPGIVTLLEKEDINLVKQPYNIRVESNIAKFYKINRIEFWKMIRNDPFLQEHVRNYYRQKIDENTTRLKRQVSNNRKGQVSAFLYDSARKFGAIDKNTDNVLIDLIITQETIADFVGISNRTSVTRIMNDLERNGVIEYVDRKILIKDLDYLSVFSKSVL